jgi:diguanylate cyclase (GGDEF)-like protein
VDDTDELAGVTLVHVGHPDQVRSLVAVPLRLGETVLGMLSAQSYAPRAYDRDDLELLELLAVNASIALSNARLFEQVQYLAITDPLTGLYNRRQFFALAEREFVRALRYHRAVAVLMLDIDHFKAVNDAHGHPIGDEVLRAVAGRCASGLRTMDLLGRYGGEEFVALLPETDWDGAQQAAERLRHAIRETPIITRVGPVRVTVSVGFALCVENCPDLTALIHSADQALYAAKQGGRDRVAPQA